MASSSAPSRARRELPPPFGRIVCAVDGSRSTHLAVEQAVALAGPSTALVFVCVRDARGVGPTSRSSISAERADECVEIAVRTAAEADVAAAGEVLQGEDPRPLLLAEASRSDLVVVASHGGSRRAGIMLGSTASALVHRANVPVLVARGASDADVPFAHKILVASDGSPDAERAVELAARIGHRERSSVYLLTCKPVAHGDPQRIAAEAVELSADLGVEPTVIQAAGHPADRILETAAVERVSLVVLGSRGLSGVRALGSVSERVAHRAACSVLVARPA